MSMAAPSSPGYLSLREIAATTKPAGDFENDVFAVAVLKHDRIPSAAIVGDDFIWFKVKAVSLPMAPSLPPLFAPIQSNLLR
jgi:hypothetical protein